MDNKIGAYRESDTLGKSQLDLILQVYDGALSYYKQARDAYADENWDNGYKTLEKARKFVVHLYTTLDPEKGGEVAENLGKLYTYVIAQTDLVVATKDIAVVDSIIEVLANLRKGWQGLKEKQPAAAKESDNKTPVPETSGFSISV